MMSNRHECKNNKANYSATTQTIRNALFVAFGIWLLYQIKEPYTKSVALHLNYERMINTLGRKGLVKPLKSTHGHDSNLNLADVKNADEVNDDGFGFKEHKKGDNKNESSFNGVKKLELVSIEWLTKTKSNKPNYIFLDENGIPEIDRGKFFRNESTKPDNETRA